MVWILIKSLIYKIMINPKQNSGSTGRDEYYLISVKHVA